MYRIKIENCNNIADGELDIEDGKLNILYGIRMIQYELLGMGRKVYR